MKHISDLALMYSEEPEERPKRAARSQRNESKKKKAGPRWVQEVLCY